MTNKATDSYNETYLYTKEEKIKWFGEGEWVDEPDVIEFEHAGLRCCVCRNVSRETCEEFHMWGGNLNGYVGIDETHPLYGKKTHEIYLDVHGGVTFSDHTDKGAWIGFDCAHSEDLVPSTQQIKKELFDDIFPANWKLRKCPIFNPTYRNKEYVISECKKLADQIKTMKLNIEESK
jgi:hypothetical protein